MEKNLQPEHPSSPNTWFRKFAYNKTHETKKCTKKNEEEKVGCYTDRMRTLWIVEQSKIENILKMIQKKKIKLATSHKG